MKLYGMMSHQSMMGNDGIARAEEHDPVERFSWQVIEARTADPRSLRRHPISCKSLSTGRKAPPFW